MFKLIDIIKHYDYVRYMYESDWYKFSICVYNSGLNLFNVETKNTSNKVFLPKLYIRTDLRTDEFDTILIETTSYGSLNIEDIQKVIDGFTIAKAEVIGLTNLIRNKEWLYN